MQECESTQFQTTSSISQQNRVVISKKDVPLCSFPALAEDKYTAQVLNLPLEIFVLIGSFLGAEDLAHAQEVSKSWYWAFGLDSLWLSHLPPFQRKRFTKSYSAKVEVVFQKTLRECWREGDVVWNKIKLPNPHKDIIEGMLMSPDGSWILTYSWNGTIALLTGVGSEYVTVHLIEPNPHKVAVRGGMISLDGTTITFGNEGYVVKWKGLGSDNVTWTILASSNDSELHHSGTVLGGSLSEDGERGFTFGELGKVVLWTQLNSDTPKGLLIAGDGILLNPHQSDYIFGGSIAPDGSWGVTLGEGIIVFWRGLNNGHVTCTALRDHPHGTSYIEDCVIYSDGTLSGSTAITVGAEGRIVQWTNVDSEKPIYTLIAGTNTLHNPHAFESVDKITLSPDGTWSLTLSTNQIVVVWMDIHKSSRTWKDITPKIESQDIIDVLFSPDNRWIVVFTCEGEVMELFTGFPNATIEI